MIFENGRVCVKIAGRDAGKHCVVLEAIDANYVVVEGPEVRKRKINIAHLEPLADKIDAKKDARQHMVEKYGIKISERKKEKSAKKEKPVKMRGVAKEKKEKKK